MMDRDEAKIEYIIRAKASLRADLSAKSWEEKVRSIERMNEFNRLAQKAMREAKEREARS